MLKNASRLAVTLLFLLSLLTWFYLPILITWELSVVTTQLGLLFAILTLAALIPLKPWSLVKPPFRPVDVVFIALGVVAIGSFVAPIVTAFEDHAGEFNVAKILLPPESLLEFKRYDYIAGNGKTPLNLDLYLPRKKVDGPGAGKTPFVLIVHGGGWINGDSQQIAVWHSHLAREGYAVISIDYRLSPGWIWPAPKDDAFEALKFIKAHADEWNIDTARWVIMGRSAGAQIAGTVAYALHGDKRPKGFISFYDPTDLIFGYGVGKEDDILHSRVLLRGLFNGAPEKAKALYESASVMGAVTSDACPTLLVHGEGDTIVWVKHSERLLKVLKDFGIDSQLVKLRFGPHGFDYFFNGPEAQVATTEVDRFLARVLPLGSPVKN